MGWLALAAIGAALWTRWLDWRYPVRPRPRYKFCHWLPRLLRTGAVTCLGWCFVRRAVILPHHRAHEEYHHSRVVALGRWRHLARYCWNSVAGLIRWGLARTVADGAGRAYLLAYHLHPEEIMAREYADANYTAYVALGSSRSCR